jgi:hypothetical protein
MYISCASGGLNWHPSRTGREKKSEKRREEGNCKGKKWEESLITQ